MITRLDRLLLLLDKGANSSVRKVAAFQIGEIHKFHPEDLNNLLEKIHLYLKSDSWETRTAAVEAVRWVAVNVPKWTPNPSPTSLPNDSSNPSELEYQLSFDIFDIENILEYGIKMFGSEGSEYDYIDNTLISQKLENHKRKMAKKLNLDVPYGTQIDLEEKDFDGVLIKDEQKEDQNLNKESFKEMSTREINRIKRLKRSKKSIKNEKKNIPVEATVFDCIVSFSSIDLTMIDNPEEKSQNTSMSDWPFASFCKILCYDLFSPKWETRHGAGASLREIILIHGDDSGKSSTYSSNLQEHFHIKWLEDVTIRLLCVFALDKVGDFAFDQVVTPVRETCAQTLGVVSTFLPDNLVKKTINVLLSLQSSSFWEVRYGGLLGWKYTFAVRKELVNDELHRILPSIVKGLQDQEDDVRAVTAEFLLPILNDIVTISQDFISKLSSIIWSLLSNMDELTGSTVHIFALLNKMLKLNSSLVLDDKNTLNPLKEKIFRLTPFFIHTNKSVRLASLQSLDNILQCEYQNESFSDVSTHLFENLFFTLITNEDELIVDAIMTAWNSLLSILQKTKCDIFTLTSNLMNYWFRIVSLPRGCYLHLEDSSLSPKNNSIIPQKTINHPNIPFDRDCSLSLRLRCCKALSLICFHYTNQSSLSYITDILINFLTSSSCCKRLVAALFLWDFVDRSQLTYQSFPPALLASIQEILDEQYEVLYQEMEGLRRQMRNDIYDIIQSFHQKGLPIQFFQDVGDFRTFNEEMSLNFISNIYPKWWLQMKATLTNNKWLIVDSKKVKLEETIKQLSEEQMIENVSILGMLSCFCILSQMAFTKLNPIILPIMKSLRCETNKLLQERSSYALSLLIKTCSHRHQSLNSKVIKNIGNFASSLIEIDNESIDNNENSSQEVSSIQYETMTILTETLKFSNTIDGISLVSVELKSKFVQSRGGKLSLSSIFQLFSDNVFDCIPYLWSMVYEPLKDNLNTDSIKPMNEYSLILHSLHLLSLFIPLIHSSLHQKLFQCSFFLLNGLAYSEKYIRYKCAESLALFCKTNPTLSFPFIISHVLPLSKSSDELKRLGAIQTIRLLIRMLDLKIVPLISFFVFPVLGRMNDQNPHISHFSAQCFASLVKLMPLELGSSSPEWLDENLCQLRLKERQFVSQLMENTLVENNKKPSCVNATLRPYQQEGLNWLSFLKRYNLSGILGDDMGLGKTLQTICILSNTLDETDDDGNVLPHLVVSPSTLCNHWFLELNQFAKTLKVIQYVGLPSNRINIRPTLKSQNVIITSYDIVRKDIGILSTLSYSYCVLDEGHIIKNPKNKISMAVKSIRANHRLVLSGTPIQNNVIELWSLFDFLMPGFLGKEKKFHEIYEKPIMQNRIKNENNQQNADLALESLQKQVLPFILRRLKDDVLSDLPPKIVQDYYCELSPLQNELYNAFTHSLENSNFSEELTRFSDNQTESKEKPFHMFQVLQYFRNLCSHPKLVLKPNHPRSSILTLSIPFNSLEYQSLSKTYNINSIENSTKLLTLMQLLIDCGIAIVADVPNIDSTGLNSYANHRALIFCQTKKMLDIIETDLLNSYFPSVSYLRLDGQTEISKRVGLVQKFNSDPTIDLLLLTTHVGGLGLNLIGADTVIFMEHDWNPMKDIQAMDRAHRIGQKRVVNIYRLITKSTIEDKVMNLQKFKLNIANSVVTTDNVSLKTMNTTHLLDLFDSEDKKQKTKKNIKTSSIEKIVEDLGDLWDESQYKEEYNIDSFLDSLNPNKLL